MSLVADQVLADSLLLYDLILCAVSLGTNYFKYLFRINVIIWWGFRYTHNSFTSCNDDFTSPKVSCTLCFRLTRLHTDRHRAAPCFIRQAHWCHVTPNSKLQTNLKMTKDNHRIEAKFRDILSFHLCFTKIIF